ncbi:MULTISPECIES: serine hydrolase [unclassified Massilia]|uniref:serine hydrolase n=1 Tax=unclassified Massilia TaxID=2609279 RepID=UPI00177FF4D2|nr:MULTISPECIES: serine hydrolase [unclassified Massilia]MBD8530108.1 serine hydrolase [Massilia sp. CFBP 13647]MBD8674063.1 serine hydrolase [Massilia sp. CFBP 13721]
MIKKLLAAALLSISSAAAIAVPFGSQSVLVVEDDTGKILLEKNAGAVVPIASLTKLMTAMVILDAKQDMNELIEIDRSDVDTLKHSTSRVPVGASIPRGDVLQLALMSSDNRAAAALGRTYPGGLPAFKAAVRRKIATLGMSNTVIEEPTGLSPNNRSTAADLVKMAQAASHYKEITDRTTDAKNLVSINGREVEYHNTNRLVGAKGWDIGLSKTGYIQEAGRCLIMSIKAGGKNATMVLLNAGASSARILDALNVRRYIAGEEAPVARIAKAARSSRVMKAGSRAPRIAASSGGARIKAASGRVVKVKVKVKAGVRSKAKVVATKKKVVVVRKRRN